MAEANLQISSLSTGSNALPKLEAYVNLDHWLPLNAKTKKYVEDNKARLLSMKNLELDLESDISMKDKTYKDLLYDFAVKFRNGRVDGVEEYFKLLDNAKQIKLLVDCGLH